MDKICAAFCPARQAAAVLPYGLRQGVLALPESLLEEVEEFRLRAGQPLTVVTGEEERPVSDQPVGQEELHTTLEVASGASVHTVLDKVRGGYVTIRGGHRIGLCGTAATREGHIATLRRLTSLSIRVARQVNGAGAQVLPHLWGPGGLESALILAPPGWGKTTLLRDLIRLLSRGEGCPPVRVGVADERGELAAVWEGVPQMDLGPRADVMDGCAKAEGLMVLLRGMNPQALAMDEITAPEDVEAAALAAGCGVALLATSHGASAADLRRRPLYRKLLGEGIFTRLVVPRGSRKERRWAVEALP